MKNFIFEKKKISLVKRIRIPENRDLINGIRLNRNERVENFDRNILSKIFKTAKEYDLGKYPDQSETYKVLSKYIKVPEKNIQISSGIDGSIKSIFEIFTDQNEKIAVLSPTYAMYEVYCKVFNTKLIRIGYKKFKLDQKKLFKVIKNSGIRILFIPNPNQPIEDNLSPNQIKKICIECRKKKILLVVDEAYHMFGCKSAINLYKSFDNILILRTLSKSFGIPSVRFGYIVGKEKVIKILDAYRLSYESNFLTDHVVKFFIKNSNYINSYITRINKGRDFLKKELKKLNFEVYGGQANFLLINFKNDLLKDKIVKSLNKNKIYTKSNYINELSSCILVTCGFRNTMNKLLKIIKKAKRI